MPLKDTRNHDLESYDMATRLDKTICLVPCKSSLNGYVTFQGLEGKSRIVQRINMSIQFNPFARRWELFDDSSSEDRHQWIKEAYPNYLMPINSRTDVDLGKRKLRRYFIKGSFESGGRLFGGFWQELNKDQRKNIITDDEEAVSLD